MADQARRPRYLIVGNGVAGVNVAKNIAESGVVAEITIYTAETHPYYNRWQLPALLGGELRQEDIYFYPEKWYTERGIAVHLGQQVKAVHLAAKQITLADGHAVEYDRLLLATGSHAFVPPIEGANKAGVFVMRTLDDALTIKEYAAHSRRAIVIGGGLLGLETAHGLRALGLAVTVVEFFPRLLPRQLDVPGAAIFQELVERSGIVVVTGASTERILGNEKAEGVQLKNGDKIDGGLIIISAGIRPNIQLAKEAGIRVNRGVVVDEHMLTSAEDVYAAGDVAEFNGQIYGIIPAAIEQARVVALNMMKANSAVYQGTLPSATLKVVGIDLTSIGEVNPEGEGYTELRYEDRLGGVYRKVVLRDGRLVGAILLGDKKNVAPVTRLIKAETNLSDRLDHLSELVRAEKDLDFRVFLAGDSVPRTTRYGCTICGYVYGSSESGKTAGVPPVTPFEALPGSWICPICGASKALFTKLED